MTIPGEPATADRSVIGRIPGAVRLERLIGRIVPRGALLLSFLSLVYFGMGLIRNRVFAQTFGAGAELDAYNAAIRIPEIALDVLVAAGLTAPFVPIFTSLRRSDERAATQFGRTVLTAALLVMLAALGLLFAFAPAVADAVVPSFDAPTRRLYVELLRINCLAQLAFAASITLGEILIANRRFAFYALAPVLYTGGIVATTVIFGDRFGIHATAWGAVLGAFAHLAIRVIGILRTPFRYRPELAIRMPAFREFLRLMLPRMATFPIEPVTLAYFTSLAAGLGAGSVTALNFALDFQVVPVTLIGVQFSLAVFPTLSAAFAAGDLGAFRAILVRNVLVIGGLTTIAAVALFVLGELGIRILLAGGRFDEGDVALTSAVVAAFALSVPFDSLAYPLGRALYATHNTIYQALASIGGLVTIIVVATALIPSQGLIAIPLAYAAGVFVKVLVLGAATVVRLGRLRERASPASSG